MSIPDEALKKYRHAGKTVAEVREKAKEIVYEGMLILDLCEKVEALIREKGCELAFPCNVSINEIAAHYSSPPQDKQTIPKGALVKIDLGAHVDGYIADSAVTVCFNSEYENLVYAANRALEKAVEILRPGLSISQFGSTIQSTITSYGLKPISNLTGHQIGRYLIHTGKSLPNVSHPSLTKINAGEVYGVEPFVTVPDAAGKVKDSSETFIFRFVKHKSLKNPFSKRLLNYISKNFRTLPFSERWLQGLMSRDNYKVAFSELLSTKSLTAYPVFVEASGKPVAQAEHTVLITEDGCTILT
jgi:methionyl aminopeptidase